MPCIGRWVGLVWTAFFSTIDRHCRHQSYVSAGTESHVDRENAVHIYRRCRRFSWIAPRRIITASCPTRGSIIHIFIYTFLFIITKYCFMVGCAEKLYNLVAHDLGSSENMTSMSHFHKYTHLQTCAEHSEISLINWSTSSIHVLFPWMLNGYHTGDSSALGLSLMHGSDANSA